ncbi:MAG TPA: AMP-binding protein [Vineibacter sp.]|nr:AMP-binding protein [Vineibacter sp.]
MDSLVTQAPTTVPAMLAAANPDAVAVMAPEGEFTYAALDEASGRVAAGLRRLGVGPGDRVAIWLPNIPAWLATFFACARLGAIAMAVNTRFRSSELADILGRSGAKILVFWPAFKQIDFAGILADCDRDALRHITTFVAYGQPAAGGAVGRTLFDRPVESYDSLAGSTPLPDVAGTGDSGCAIFTTSGTSNRPKFVLHDQRTLVAHSRAVARAKQVGPHSATLLVPPLCGVFGLSTTLTALAGGGRVLMSPVWNAEDDAEKIVRHGVTHMPASDTALTALLKQPQAPLFGRTLRHVGYACFSPGEADIIDRADAVGLHLSGLYGSSELQALLASADPDEPIDERRLGGGWLANPTSTVRARDPESGRVLPHGETGELEFHAPDSVMRGYFGNPEATAAAFTDDGWFRSGDLGYTRAANRFVYLARMGDVLRLGGYLVNPAEIEEVVQECDGVAECQVIGVTVGGELKPVAFVVARADTTIDEATVKGHATRRLARHKVPLRVLVIDAFPVTMSANGTKIQKAKLRELALAAIGTT